MNDNEFLYFLHGTTITDQNYINDVFNNGLLNFKGSDLRFAAWPVKLEDGDILTQAKNYAASRWNLVIVIKIPKYYLTPEIENGEMQQVPLPIWKLIKTDENGQVCQLAPELVYGIYRKDNGLFIPNPNYSPVHNPTGLHYDKHQIEYFLDNNIENIFRFALDRKTKSYEQLSDIDNALHNWDDAIESYTEHFGDDELQTKR